MEFSKESPVYYPRSRPQAGVATWISLVCSCSVATLLLLLRLVSLQLLGLMVATSFVVATLLAQCFSRVDVTTTVSRRDLVVFPFFCILSHDLSFELGLLFLVTLHIVTSVLSCDHISVSTALLQVVTFFFSGCDLVCGLLPSQVSNLSHDLKVMSRPLLMFISLLLVATSILCCNQFPPSNLYSRSRPHVALFLVACSPNCSKVVATWISSAQFFFRS